MKGEILRCPDCNRPVEMFFADNKYVIRCKNHITVERLKLSLGISEFKKYAKLYSKWNVVNSSEDLEIGRGKQVVIMYDDGKTDIAWIGDNLNLSKDFIEIDIKKICAFKFL